MHKQHFYQRKLIQVILGLPYIALLYFGTTYAGQEKIGFILIALLLVSMLWDYIRIEKGFLKGHLLFKEREHNFVHRSTFIILATIVVFALFDIRIAFAAICMSIFGDAAATFFGLYFGKTKINKKNDKTWMGFLMNFIVNLIIGFLFIGEPMVIFWMAFSAAIIEAHTEKLEDNLLIPIVSGSIGSFILLLSNM